MQVKLVEMDMKLYRQKTIKLEILKYVENLSKKGAQSNIGRLVFKICRSYIKKYKLTENMDF